MLSFSFSPWLNVVPAMLSILMRTDEGRKHLVFVVIVLFSAALKTVIATDTCMFAKVGQLQACVRLGWKDALLYGEDLARSQICAAYDESD
jgi:hypothetical protein